MLDAKIWLVFLWSASFASVAYVIDWASRRARRGPPNRDPTLARRAGDTYETPEETGRQRRIFWADLRGIALWGGLAGWVLHVFWPAAVDGNPELLGVLSALLGRGGVEFTRMWITRSMAGYLKGDSKGDRDDHER